MPSLTAYLPAVLFAGLLAWVVYRNVKRTFGPQLVRRGRMTLRAVLLCVVGVVLLVLAPSVIAIAAAIVAAGAGAAMARYSLLHTRFESAAGGLTYTKNPWIGGVVTALFLGRIVFRTVMTMQMMSATHAAAGAPPVDVGRGPLTNAVFFLMAGYYVTYYVGVLRRAREVA